MNRKSIILVAFLIVLMALGSLSGWSGETDGKTDKPKKDYSNIVENSNISIPGYESIDFMVEKKIFEWGDNGTIDHVGIVESVMKGTVNTVEGNLGDRVKRHSYSIGDNRIYGYGVPAY